MRVVYFSFVLATHLFVATCQLAAGHGYRGALEGIALVLLASIALPAFFLHRAEG